METNGEKQSSSERVYKVALVSSSEKFNGAMLPLLPKNRFSPISVYRDAKSARRVISKEKPDIVIINTPLPDDFGTSLALDVSETDGVCILLFTRAENFSELSSVLAPHGVLTLPKPTSPELTEEVVELMCATRERLRRIEIKKSFAEGRMEDIRVVNKAKWFLIEQLKMTEQEAHRYIEKQAMDRCVTKRVIAENILSTYKKKRRNDFMTKYIFVTGGVVSGLGKGITAASLGRLLKARGLKVIAQKLDPYINVDPGTMSPYQHGEVYVTEDGCETDLDLGHYERFIDENLNKYSNLTTGKVFWNVLNKERRGEYLGSTVQIIPHVTNEIKEFIYHVGKEIDADVVITEIGGTIGDIESQPFIEAIRQVGIEVGTENSLYIHVTLVPFLSGSDEHKSKPTQHSVKELQGMGIRPDVIVLRADEPLEESIFKKIALFCNVKPDCVIENITLPCLYEAPLMLEKSNFSSVVLRELHIDNVAEPDLNDWKQMVKDIKTAKKHVTIGLVGKYVQLHDAYLSVAEALRHAGYFLGAKVDIKWIDSETITPDSADEILSGLDGIIVPGGFGSRGIEGMILAAKYARENNVPYFGICLGMQIAVIEYARNVAGIRDAHSGEFDELCKNKVINFMPGQSDDIDKGGTLRLGAYPCVIKENTTMQRCYGTLEISERHRHRYEFNNDYREILTKNGLTLSGLSPDGRLVETVELTDRPFYVGVQFHPEFKSRPNRVHPLFKGFIEAALQK